MLTLILILITIISANYLRTSIMDTEKMRVANIEEANGFNFNKVWNTIMYDYGLPLAEYCVSVSYIIYMRLTVVNVVVFILKYVPTGFYMYKFIKDVYLTSRERINQKQLEVDDIQLQINIVNTKLCFRDAEFTERAEQLRRGAERLRNVRARVRHVIANDEGLRHALNSAAQWDVEQDDHLQTAPKEQDREFVVELLKELKNDHWAENEKIPEKDCSDHEQTNTNASENSVYSSLSDGDVRQDCRVKIVKVTNVYKVAYLKHYIKQKRLRRATKQALMRKKMENFKNLLEDWQKTLNMVINSKLTVLNIDSHPMDVASQEAMGDYSKPRGSSDSDSDIRNSWPDTCYDEYTQNWGQNQYRPYPYNYEDIPNAPVLKELYEAQDYGDGRLPTPPFCCDRSKTSKMMSIIEETNSQIAIEENKSEIDDDYNSHDLEFRDIIVL